MDGPKKLSRSKKEVSLNSMSSAESGSDGRTVAVIGAGISGLAAAFILKRQGRRVTLFEREHSCGGHALTVPTNEFGPIDIGFQVCNLTTYPHLMGLLRELGVDTEPSDMSFALSTPSFEWGSRGIDSVFAQPGSARSPRFIYMLYEVIRFGQQALEVLVDDNWEKATLQDYLHRRRYSAFFSEHYVVPMVNSLRSRTRVSHTMRAEPDPAGVTPLQAFAPFSRLFGPLPCSVRQYGLAPTPMRVLFLCDRLCAFGRTTTCSTSSTGLCGAC